MPKVAVALSEPVIYTLPLLSILMPLLSSLYLPPALLAQSTLPFLSYFAKKISSKPALSFFKVSVPKIILEFVKSPVTYILPLWSVAIPDPALLVVFPPANFVHTLLPAALYLVI